MDRLTLVTHGDRAGTGVASDSRRGMLQDEEWLAYPNNTGSSHYEKEHSAYVCFKTTHWWDRFAGHCVMQVTMKVAGDQQRLLLAVYVLSSRTQVNDIF